MLSVRILYLSWGILDWFSPVNYRGRGCGCSRLMAGLAMAGGGGPSYAPVGLQRVGGIRWVNIACALIARLLCDF